MNHGSYRCDDILSGYSKVMSIYTAIFSSFDNLSNSISNDNVMEFNLNSYLKRSVYGDPIVSLSQILSYFDSYSATANFIEFWYHKLDEDTKKHLSRFSKYALQYRKETGSLLNNCSDYLTEWSKNNYYVESSFIQKNGKYTDFLWKPINEYLDIFWERRVNDGTADQVQTIFELVASFNVSE